MYRFICSILKQLQSQILTQNFKKTELVFSEADVDGIVLVKVSNVALRSVNKRAVFESF